MLYPLNLDPPVIEANLFNPASINPAEKRSGDKDPKVTKELIMNHTLKVESICKY